MKLLPGPRFERRRTADFSAELKTRAAAWLPEWGLADAEGDFGRALLEIAARFQSEVAERLDGAGDKMQRGFLDWLGVRGKAARPARMPVVFKLTDSARDAVMASAPVRLQADAAGSPVIFETERDVRLIPGRIATLVAVDPVADAIYFPPPGLNDLAPLEPAPVEWRVKSFASAGASTLQLDPEAGLVPGMVIQAAGHEYRIVKVDNDLVTIEPPLEQDLPNALAITEVTVFAPFGGTARNWQNHVLYLGDSDLFNVEAPASIEVVGARALRDGITWEYWGKAGSDPVPRWQPLTPQFGGSLVLTKPRGAVEEREINGRNARWIRAAAKTVGASADVFTAERIAILMNSAACGSGPKCPPDDGTPPVAAEGVANTTPLVLENLFYPLGREPRQFDAFYLGSAEAFSKANANVQLCFEVADRTFANMSAVRAGTFANGVLVGVSRDRTLHFAAINPSTGAISKFRDPVQPPKPGYAGANVAGNPVPLDEPPKWRLPVWSEVDFFLSAGFLVAAPAGDAVWVWHEHSLRMPSGWIDFGRVPLPLGAAATAPIDGLVYLGGPLMALRAGALYTRAWPNGSEWTWVPTEDAGTDVKLKSIVPVITHDVIGNVVTTQGMAAIDENRKLFHVAAGGACTPLMAASNFLTGVQPVAIEVNGKRVVAAVTDTTPRKIAAHCDGLPSVELTLPANAGVTAALDVVIANAAVHVLAVVGEDTNCSLVSWSPFTTAPAATTGGAALLYESAPPFGTSALAGAPTAIGSRVVIPGPRAEILVNDFDPARRAFHSANIQTCVIVSDSTPSLAIADVIAKTLAGNPESRDVAAAGITQGVEVLYPISSQFSALATGPLLAFRSASALNGSFATLDELTLDPNDNVTGVSSWLEIDGDFYRVDTLDTTVAPPVAIITGLNGAGMPAPGAVTYIHPIQLDGRVAPFMDLDASNNNWDPALLDRVPIVFPGKNPAKQRGKAFTLSGGKPDIVVLDADFQSPLANPFEFVVDGAFGEWLQDAGDTSSNPELSWEYWNGKGWWKLNVADNTHHLKNTGAVQFNVPADITPSDWAGKTNHWIRARLIGGDYGREKVTVTTKDLGGGKSEQTVDRSTEGIRAPLVLKLHVSYSLCEAVEPRFVLTEDSGSFRDQSDANRTGGATVEAFVPLSVTLGRLSRGAAAASAAAPDCPPECDCPGGSSAAGARVAPSVVAAPEQPRAIGRAVFIGVSGQLSGAPVNVLALVEERNHEQFAPMSIEALVADRFVPIVADDATRALGESSVISMAFPFPPTTAGLFGFTCSWLRLQPKAGGTVEDWQPTIRGSYLNAAWASATETLTRELLGSSGGAPGLTVFLARPPVLHDTLELRVKEPLGDEDREALRSQGKDLVLGDVEELPGDWVLWKQVADPLDEGPSDRVYALDEETGEIRFGDGLHGAIPPVGRDSIVAFRYQRTEVGAPGKAEVPANTIAARTSLNLVSPVESVEAATGADQAAGGAPPEPDERVLRYGFSRIRHRERAITTADLEDLALESSPDIVQVRAIVRQGYVRLIVVMRGNNPLPTAAQVRELRTVLLAAAPESLASRDALRIEGPVIRRLRIDIQLRVDSLDHAGALSTDVKERLAKFFDTATGGVDSNGWPLGASPTADDIALALLDTPHLESIESVTPLDAAGDAVELPWPERLKPTEIALLAEDAVRLHFEPAEVTV